ncbi:hypothetical protein GH714_030205 [Hevea brasiliensis]|uniref:Pentatricopeptide repeat-containing protein n=1 Tax=Hevea brasiliensis TaxID=3981 RepID=A0A6A6LNQ4_HEVBR|nr:hypothetical protein GH714_030205 [Hevea brasiliensis]
MTQLKQAHAQAITCGLGNNSFALSRLLAFCSDPGHGSLNHSWKLFQHVQQPTICICNTMIRALLLKGELTNVFNLYSTMLQNGFVINTVVGNSLMFMYCGFSNMKAARYIFDEIPSPCAVSWTLMISGYAKAGDICSAKLFFDGAPEKDRGIWGAMISGALDTGIWIHRYLDRIGLPLSIRLSTGLIDMYAKCGNLDLAKRLFDGMPQRDTICWNVMISGLAMHGDGEGALTLFLGMEEAGFRPDDVTFIAMLSACSYSGMAQEGLRVLDRMCNVYDIEPRSEHYGCMVDLLSRAGLLQEAKEMIQRMPNSSSSSEEAVAWRALLSACCNQGQPQLAQVASEKLLQLEPHSGAYVLLSNLYATTGKHDDAKRIKKTMRNKGLNKAPGCSSIKINGIVHEFVAGEKIHKQLEEIESVLEKMKKQLNYLGCNPYPFLVDQT